MAGQCDQREGQQSVPYGQTVVPEVASGQGEQGSVQGGVQTGNSIVYAQLLSRAVLKYTPVSGLCSLSLSDPVCFGSGLSLSDCVILLWFLSDCVWSCCGLGQPSSRAASQSNVYLDTYGYCDNGQAYDTMSVDSSDSMETSISACSPDNVSW